MHQLFQRFGSIVGIIILAVCMLGCSHASSTPQAAASSWTSVPNPQSVGVPYLTLTLAWNRETYVVPSPATVPTSMEQSKAYRDWWKVGDSRTLEYEEDSGQRYVIGTLGRVSDGEGRITASFHHISRYRPDGTLEVNTTYSPDGPAEWTVYAQDGTTPVVRVVNRLSGKEGTPFIQYVYFLGPDGQKTRGYQANRYGIVYLEWFYNDDGSPNHWNGSSKLDGPLAFSK